MTNSKQFEVEEGYKYYIDSKDEIPFHFDYKNIRQIVSDYSNNKIILSLFTGNGELIIPALNRDFREFHIVGSDANFKKNLELNEISESRITLWEEDYENFLEICRSSRTKFDLILLDFSKRHVSREILDDHANIIKNLQERFLNQSGKIIFITDYKDFVMDRYIRPGADKLTKLTLGKEFEEQKSHQSFAFYE